MQARDPAVCIIGAGPAGLTVAHLLQRAGVSFLVLERDEPDALRARVKAGMIEHRTVELLRPDGMAETILGRGTRMGTCEFRADGTAMCLDYAALCAGRGNYIYPQQELVGDWAEQLLDAGGEIRFGVEAIRVEQDADGAIVSAVTTSNQVELTIECEVVACCDGASSICPIDGDGIGVSYPFRWLTLIAAAPPSTSGIVYGLHRHGFAGQMHRSGTMTRFMLEVPADDEIADWSDDRIWAELRDRLAASGRPPLHEGDFLERDILDLRVRVSEPMQAGRVFLAGDAAHLITPAGGKGMNIAIQDAVELGTGLRECYGELKDCRRLARYSDTRLPCVWRHQEFWNLMLGLFTAGTARDSDGAGGTSFAYRLRRARLDQIIRDPQYSRWFAHAYAGVDG